MYSRSIVLWEVILMISCAAAAPATNVGPVLQYGRLQLSFALESGVDRVEWTDPAGQELSSPVFHHQPGRFSYDDRGWETLAADGPMVLAARLTPQTPGRHTWRAMAGDRVVRDGSLECVPSPHPGFVQISSKDPRYFVTSQGESFAAIGLNICWPPTFALPAGGEFKTSGLQGTLGIHEYERWFDLLSANGGNFARLWCGVGYLESQKQQMGQVDPLAFNRLDAAVEAARQRGIRLKLCIDSFREIKDALGNWFARMPLDPDSGKAPADMSEFLDSPRWRGLWLAKIDQYAARYADDPTVAVIEPWNEMNCVSAPWAKTLEWNRSMLGELRKRFPRQLVVNSLGSFDGDWCVQHHADMRALPGQMFDQVHRYLDQGSKYRECHDPVLASIDAIRRMAQPHRPVLLAETGGVNDNHTGAFRFYRWDDRGIIFHDTTFPAFFAGSAGTGQEWFWDSTVDQKNLWSQYRTLADLIAGIDLPAESFTPADLSTDDAWCLLLVGRNHTLIWLRNRGDTWQNSLRDRKEPRALSNLAISLPKAGTLERALSCWSEQTATVTVDGAQLRVPSVRYGMMLRVRH
jgi:hypothetical protein